MIIFDSLLSVIEVPWNDRFYSEKKFTSVSGATHIDHSAAYYYIGVQHLPVFVLAKKSTVSTRDEAKQSMQNRTNLLDVCKSQLEQLYTDLTQHHTRIYAIRQWCITVWLATLAITASGKLDLNIMQAIFLTTAPVAMFWILDGFQSAFVRVNTERAKKLEAMVVDSSALATFGLDHFYVSGYEKIPYRQKFRHFLRALFLSETVFFFYLLLLFGSLVFVIVLGFPTATPG